MRYLKYQEELQLEVPGSWPETQAQKQQSGRIDR